MLTSFTVLYDACVLYPAPLRDLLMHLALTDLFRAKWSNLIHEEWIKNLLKNRPDLLESNLRNTQSSMNKAIPDALVKDFEYLIPILTLPNSKDIHVLAAAIHSGTDLIVTYNLKDFPEIILSKHNIEAQHPDEFITNLIGLSPETVINAMKKQRQELRKPPKTVEEYIETLKKQNLFQTVVILTEYLYLL